MCSVPVTRSRGCRNRTGASAAVRPGGSLGALSIYVYHCLKRPRQAASDCAATPAGGARLPGERGGLWRRVKTGCTYVSLKTGGVREHPHDRVGEWGRQNRAPDSQTPTRLRGGFDSGYGTAVTTIRGQGIRTHTAGRGRGDGSESSVRRRPRAALRVVRLRALLSCSYSQTRGV
jgi:hypothetical protein